MLKYTGISYLLQAMFISAAAFPQMSDHTAAAIIDTPQQTARRLLLNIPCLPCHQTDDSGHCRLIYGCLVVDADNETTTAVDTDEVDYGKDDVQNTTDTELSIQPLNKPLYESLCLPCFEVDNFFRCRRVKGCVVSTVAGPPDSSVHSTPLSGESTTSEAYSENSTLLTTSSTTGNTQDQDFRDTATVDERTSAPDFSDHDSGSPNITISTAGNIKNSSESPIPTTPFITDIPLLKTFSPSAVTQLNATTDITIDTTQDGSSPPDILLKTPTSPLLSLPTSERTSLEDDNGTVVTTQVTMTTTSDPCRNKNGDFGINIWCYFKNLWKWKR